MNTILPLSRTGTISAARPAAGAGAASELALGAINVKTFLPAVPDAIADEPA